MQTDAKPKKEQETKTLILSDKKVDKKKVARSKLKRRILKHVWVVRLVILAGLASVIYLLIIIVGQWVRESSFGFYAGLARDFVLTPSGKFRSIEGRTNILILGKGGVGHDAPDLTDTIIFASFSHQEPQIILISLPRDIWIPTLRAKLNSVYYWGNQRQPNGGIVLSKATVEEIVGQPVHYAAVIDFSGFRKVIDVIGGVEVDVERGFVDERYPIPGREDDLCEGDPEFKCRYETIRFEKGKQIMDGETALKFVRSRNAQGDEGTDIAREIRQQKVITALKDKILSREVLLMPKKLFSLKDAILDSTETDIDSSAAAIIARRALNARNNVASYVIPEEFLENPPISPRYDNLYVFIPASGDWSRLQEWVECVLENEECQ